MPALRASLVTLALAFVVQGLAAGGSVRAEQSRTRHFASNGNFDRNGTFAPARAGFDIADVSSLSELDRLPEGVKGLVWLGQCRGADATFRNSVQRFIDNPKLYGFYLMDDPDPTGRWHPSCPASKLKAESDWIHHRRADAVTFVELMNLGSFSAPSYGGWYTPQTTHADLFGIAPYPCRLEWSICRIDMIDRFVAAARTSGIPLSKLVPTYQTFGLGAWRTDSGGRYRMPSVEELKLMLDRWQRLLPSPAFDYTYSWGTQRSDIALQDSAKLQAVFRRRWRDER